MASALLTTALLLTSAVAHAQGINGNYGGMLYGGPASQDATEYIRENLPYRNGTEYPLVYLPFNWTDPVEDNGVWTVRFNTADNWLPANLSVPDQKVVVTSYALQWSGKETYSNLSAKINNDTGTLRAAGIRQSPPNMCFGMMGFDSDFEESVKRRMDIRADDPCTTMLGEECMASVRRAYTQGIDDDTCSFSRVSTDDLPGCGDTWDKMANGMTFASTSIGNGSQASNTSYASPEFDDVIAQQAQEHAAGDNSTYEKELRRIQLVVLKESGKQAQVLCTRFEGASWRVAAGAGPLLLSVGVVVAMMLEVI